MISSKKHPLEIFRKEDRGFQGGAKRRQRSRVGKPRPAEDLSREPPQTARVNASRNWDKGRSPGDFTVTLTMNHILLSFLCVIVLVICGYFVGFSKGASTGPETSLSHANTAPTFLKDPTRPEESRGARPSPGPASPGSPETGSGSPAGVRYGVLIASYNRDMEDILDQTGKVMAERGYEIHKYFYERNGKFGLIIGSYDRQNHPDLERLLRRVKAIDDFPGGDPAPFKTALIARHPKTRG